jgi:hypothetical protein
MYKLYYSSYAFVSVRHFSHDLTTSFVLELIAYKNKGVFLPVMNIF